MTMRKNKRKAIQKARKAAEAPKPKKKPHRTQYWGSPSLFSILLRRLE